MHILQSDAMGPSANAFCNTHSSKSRAKLLVRSLGLLSRCGVQARTAPTLLARRVLLVLGDV